MLNTVLIYQSATRLMCFKFQNSIFIVVLHRNHERTLSRMPAPTESGLSLWDLRPWIQDASCGAASSALVLFHTYRGRQCHRHNCVSVWVSEPSCQRPGSLSV